MGKELTLEKAKAQISALKKQTKYLAEKINQHYLEQLKLSKKKIFGS